LGSLQVLDVLSGTLKVRTVNACRMTFLIGKRLKLPAKCEVKVQHDGDLFLTST
jgi:hypothetical protein